MKVTKLKGGSLSSTVLVESDSTKFVRKSVNTTKDREYGFIRWYSQLKKMQRLSELHNSLFPKILNVGYENGNAFFDMEYLSGFTDIKTIFTESNVEDTQIKKINDALWKAFDALHSYTYKSLPNISFLYFIEEIEQKILDAKKMSSDFYKFTEQDYYIFNGNKISNLAKYKSSLEKIFKNLKIDLEGNIHGNPTLENIMYSFDENRVVFIDPYEESVVDTKYLDYSMVLQCSRSYYGFINDNSVSIDFPHINKNNKKIPHPFIHFNTSFEEELTKRVKNLNIIFILEASQFIRMLPFKCAAGEVEKAKYFYAHASNLIERCINE